MEDRRIANTSIEVSPICLGTMTFGTPVSKEDAVKMMHYAYDKGVNFVDTANMYEGYSRSPGSPGGVAEEIVGKAIAGRRGDFVVGTKVGMKVGVAAEDEGTSAAAIRKHLDLSLRRLGTDYIDLYYLHKPDPASSLLESIQALSEAIRAGKILHYGTSNFNAEQMEEVLRVADGNGLPRPVITQPGMSMLKQDAVADLLPLCEREQIAVTPYQILQSGLLTGKYKRGQDVPSDSRKAEKEGWVWEFNDELFDKLEAIEADAGAAGQSMTQYAIGWMLRQPAVVSAVVGVKRADQLDEAIGAMK